MAAWPPWLEQATGANGLYGDDNVWVMVGYSFNHFRLGRLYTQLGEYDRAEEHYLTFLETFTEPDPEYAWMVTEARAKLEELARGR